MTLRNASGKFSLSGLGRKVSGIDHPPSPGREYGTGTDEDSTVRDHHGAAFDGLGKKLKGSLAHQNLLPQLGHKDLRALQDIIASEKGMMQMVEKLAVENQKASASLSPYGIQEGPDLQDILTQSSALLNHLNSALNVFASHQTEMRVCLKRIRMREEALIELKAQRKSTGAKAENAERKLAKMSPENKALPQQTDLLEKLRGDMRTMDQDIISEETKIGDFKRQTLKEALSLKFGGLEELGEKMCIIGELGKLLLEEIPLEETPIGYGRAPYMGYEKTENAVQEATKCLATVQFHTAGNTPKPPGLPQPSFTAPTHTPSLPLDERSVTAADHANLPVNVLQPFEQDTGVEMGKEDYSLDAQNPYGGIESNPYVLPTIGGHENVYSDFGGMRNTNPGHVRFQPHSPNAPATSSPSLQINDHVHPPDAQENEHSYEYEQQRQMDAVENPWSKLDAVEADWKKQQAGEADLPNPHVSTSQTSSSAPWEPLNLKRERASEAAIHDATVPSPPPAQTNPSALAVPETQLQHPEPTQVVTSTDLAPPVFRPDASTPGINEYHTPMGSPAPESREGLQGYEREYFPANMGTGGKISAAAFRKGTKPKTSLGPEELAPAGGIYGEESSNSNIPGVRRLPAPPQSPAGVTLPANTETQDGLDLERHISPPPEYGAGESLR
nr:hypothetical protein L203_01226 [Cryptococcus depauperatus CBS 7841]